MRGLLAIVALIAATAGMLVVVAYGGSEAFLRISEDDPDLNGMLLLDSVAPSGWQASSIADVNLSETFVAPCLRTPLLEGASIRNRGAMEYAPLARGQGPVELLIIQTSPAGAAAIMDDVLRDTEDDCQRGVTVGTVSNARTETLDPVDADRMLQVSFDRPVLSGQESYVVSIVQQDEYVALLSAVVEDNAKATQDGVLGVAEGLAARIARPPTVPELEAAGVLSNPSTAEEYALRVRDETARLLTAAGRVPLWAGAGILSLTTVLLYGVGARFSRRVDVPGFDEARIPSFESGKSIGALPMTPVAESSQRMTSLSSGDTGPLSADSTPVYQTVPQEISEEPELAAAAPPPVVDFPQRSIEEKLSILKEARLKEPPREHRAVREVRPDVDWTEEISKAESSPAPPPADPPTGPVSRKVLLKKLRSDNGGG